MLAKTLLTFILDTHLNIRASTKKVGRLKERCGVKQDACLVALVQVLAFLTILTLTSPDRGYPLYLRMRVRRECWVKLLIDGLE